MTLPPEHDAQEDSCSDDEVAKGAQPALAGMVLERIRGQHRFPWPAPKDPCRTGRTTPLRLCWIEATCPERPAQVRTRAGEP